MKKTNKLEKLINGMLTENTGKGICDSGGESGRNWQRNQKKNISDFRKEPRVSVRLPYHREGETEFEIGEIDYTISLFHFLSENLELDEFCDEFNSKFKTMVDWDSDLFYGCSKDAGEWLNERFEVKETHNTYNWCAPFSQIMQFTSLRMDGDDYVFLQIHGGCDARGGYTDGKLFKLRCEYFPMHDVYGTVYTGEGKGIQVSNRYNGETLTVDNDNCSGDSPKIAYSDKIRVELDFYN